MVVSDNPMNLTDQVVAVLQTLVRSASDAGALAAVVQPKFMAVIRGKRKSISRKTMMEIFVRDGFVDQYTGERLIFPGTLLVLGDLLPDYFPKAGPDEGWQVSKCHWVFWRLWPTVDHIVPVARGGENFVVDANSNLVTTSQMMNSAKGPWAAEEVPERMRFERITPEDAYARRWDGMTQWFLDYLAAHPEYRGRDRQIAGWYTIAAAACRSSAWKELTRT